MRTGAKPKRASRSHGPSASRQRMPAATTAQQAAVGGTTVEQRAFAELKSFAKVATSLDLSPSGLLRGNSLRCTQPAAPGEVLMRVPKSLALVLDFQRDDSLQLPEGSWPRLRQGVSRPEPPTWDVLFALAVMDGLAGDGGQFWAAWAQAVLPPPEAITLPVCWSEEELSELQHSAIQEAARTQKARLKALFPGLAQPVDDTPGACTWLEWAFACVRSRAFRLGEDAFAFVPFLDLANHGANPNADFRAQGDHFELFALRELAPGDEVLISYCGVNGHTNQRFQAQYGFVPIGGNPADRAEFSLPDGPGGLQLGVAQSGLGDGLFVDALSGNQPRLSAALRSLPWQAEDDAQLARLEDVQRAAAAAVETEGMQAAGHTVTDAGPPLAAQAQDLALAQELRRQCEEQLQTGNSLQEDEAELAALQSLMLPAPEHAPVSSGGLARKVSALHYRIERKQLFQTCRVLLDVYCRT